MPDCIEIETLRQYAAQHGQDAHQAAKSAISAWCVEQARRSQDIIEMLKNGRLSKALEEYPELEKVLSSDPVYLSNMSAADAIDQIVADHIHKD